MKEKVQHLFGNQIENIIFDLGGVLMDIDFSATFKAFSGLGFHNLEQIYAHAGQSPLFDKLDVGAISPDEFRAELRKFSTRTLSDEEVDVAWSAMLGDFRRDSWDLLLKLKNRYRTFLLSNTNAIHVPFFEARLREQLGCSVGEYFERYYYSNEIGARKPNADAFLYVLNENGLNPKHTLFIDDTLGHVKGAQLAGLNAYHLIAGEFITDLF